MVARVYRSVRRPGSRMTPPSRRRAGAATARRTRRAPAARAPKGSVGRDQLVRAAEEVFARRGYAGATTQEIARRAGAQKRMLFYYFRSKEDLYAEVLDRFLGQVQQIHERFRREPGPIGLAEVIAGLTHFVALHPDPVRILLHEIMDEGPQLHRIVRRYIGPLFAAGMEETRRNMTRGLFRAEDPMHVIVNVGGLTFFYFLIAPLLRQVWDRDPLAPDTLAERVAATSRFVLGGLAAGETRAGDGAAAAAAAGA
jgi:TetR/AcrR family transcriptional regulator